MATPAGRNRKRLASAALQKDDLVKGKSNAGGGQQQPPVPLLQLSLHQQLWAGASDMEVDADVGPWSQHPQPHTSLTMHPAGKLLPLPQHKPQPQQPQSHAGLSLWAFAQAAAAAAATGSGSAPSGPSRASEGGTTSPRTQLAGKAAKKQSSGPAQGQMAASAVYGRVSSKQQSKQPSAPKRSEVRGGAGQSPAAHGSSRGSGASAASSSKQRQQGYSGLAPVTKQLPTARLGVTGTTQPAAALALTRTGSMPAASHAGGDAAGRRAAAGQLQHHGRHHAEGPAAHMLHAQHGHLHALAAASSNGSSAWRGMAGAEEAAFLGLPHATAGMPALFSKHLHGGSSAIAVAPMTLLPADLEPLLGAAYASFPAAAAGGQQRYSSGGAAVGASIEGWPAMALGSLPAAGSHAGGSPAPSMCASPSPVGGFINTRASVGSQGGCISGFSGAPVGGMHARHSFEVATASLITQITNAAERP